MPFFLVRLYYRDPQVIFCKSNKFTLNLTKHLLAAETFAIIYRMALDVIKTSHTLKCKEKIGLKLWSWIIVKKLKFFLT